MHTITGDALVYARSSRERYDAVYIDFPLPYDYDTLKLYSVEFYQSVARLLNEDGYVAIDASTYNPSEYARNTPRLLQWNQIVLSTLYFAGFPQLVPFEGSEGFLAARIKSGPINSKFTDLGIPLKYVNQTILTRALSISIPFHPRSEDVNSIFRPKLYSLPEFMF